MYGSRSYSFRVAHSAALKQVERCIPQEIKVLVRCLEQYAIAKAIDKQSTSIAPSSNDQVISVSRDGQNEQEYLHATQYK